MMRVIMNNLRKLIIYYPIISKILLNSLYTINFNNLMNNNNSNIKIIYMIKFCM